jgi:hypothetical protein
VGAQKEKGKGRKGGREREKLSERKGQLRERMARGQTGVRL